MTMAQGKLRKRDFVVLVVIFGLFHLKWSNNFFPKNCPFWESIFFKKYAAKSRKVLTILFAFVLFLFGVCCSMIFYKKKISKETFADELGTNLAEGKIWKFSKIFEISE